MPISMHQASVPVFARGLRVLDALLDKAAGHAASGDGDADAFAGMRLAPDMLPLSGQVQRASDTAKFAVARLTGLDSPRFADDETTLAQLHRRIADTLAYVEGVAPGAFDGSESREVLLKAGGLEQRFRGDDYLLSFALPNFQFHVVAAYAILRHHGVAIGKRDFLGPLPTL